MQKWGSSLLIIGIGGILLPALGYQFKVLMLFGGADQIVAAIVAIIGILMILIGRARES